MRLFILALATLGFSAFAQTDADNTVSKTLPEVTPVENEAGFRPHFGILAGVSTPEGSFDTGAEYGIDVGFQPVIPFSLGIEFNQANYDADAGDDFSRSSFLLKGAYNFGGNIVVLKDSYIGLGAGLLVEDVGPATTTYGGLMPNLGFDIPTFQIKEDWVSLGANARYLITGSENAPDVFAVNGVLKYWF